METKADIDREALRAFCERWPIQELDLFGSALRDDFNADSDLDFLVLYSPDAKLTLIDEILMQDELEAICGRPVDLVSRRAVEESPNWIRRETILEHAEPVYVRA